MKINGMVRATDRAAVDLDEELDACAPLTCAPLTCAPELTEPIPQLFVATNKINQQILFIFISNRVAPQSSYTFQT